MAADGIFVEIGVDEAAYRASLQRMIGATNAAASRIEAAFGKIGAADAGEQFAANLERSAKRVEGAGFGYGSGLKGIAVQMAGFALIMGAAGAGGSAIKSMADFEQTLEMLKVVVNSSAEGIKPLRDQALQLGQETAVAATDVATLQTELGKLGYSLKEIQDLAPAGVNLSIISDMPAERSAEFLGAVVKQFKAAPQEVNHYVDVLAAAANRTAADINELAFSFRYVGAPARAAGASFEEVAAILGVAADNGISASMAGTSLRSVYQDLGQALPMTVQGLAQYGITLDRSKSASERFYDVLRQIEEKNLNPLNIRGLESDTATLLAALKGSSERIKELAGGLREVDGEAKRIADAKMSGLTGATRELVGAFESLAIRLGDSGLLAGMTGFLNWLKDGISLSAEFIANLNSITADEKIANLKRAIGIQRLLGMDTAPEEAALAELTMTADEKMAKDAATRARNLAREQRARDEAAIVGRQADTPFYIGPDGRRINITDPRARTSSGTPATRPPPGPVILLPAQQRAREVAQLRELAAAAQESAKAYQLMQMVQAEENAGLAEGGISRRTAQLRAAQKLELQTAIERAQVQAQLDTKFLDDQQAQIDRQRQFSAGIADTIYFQRQLTEAAGQGVEAYERLAIALDLMRQNTALTKEEALKLAEAIRGSQQENDTAVERMRQLQDAGRQMGDAVAGAFEDMILRGESFRDVLRAMASDIISIAVRTAVTNPLGEALGNVLGGVFSSIPGRAVGGPVAAGAAYRVGERGPETFIPNLPGKIVPTGGALGGGGVIINDNRVIDASGADPAAIARLERLMMQDRAMRRAEVGAIVADMRARNR